MEIGIYGKITKYKYYNLIFFCNVILYYII